MPFPRPDETSKAFFESILPDDPCILVRPMFGNFAAFVKGNMFVGLFGSDVFVRLSELDRAKLLEEEGTSIPEPMPGRLMKEYVTIPKAWRQESDRVSGWVIRSLQWAGELPEKKAKKKK